MKKRESSSSEDRNLAREDVRSAARKDLPRPSSFTFGASRCTPQSLLAGYAEHRTSQTSRVHNNLSFIDSFSSRACVNANSRTLHMCSISILSKQILPFKQFNLGVGCGCLALPQKLGANIDPPLCVSALSLPRAFFYILTSLSYLQSTLPEAWHHGLLGVLLKRSIAIFHWLLQTESHRCVTNHNLLHGEAAREGALHLVADGLHPERGATSSVHVAQCVELEIREGTTLNLATRFGDGWSWFADKPGLADPAVR